MLTNRQSLRFIPSLAVLIACSGADLLLPGDGEPAFIQVTQGNDQTGRVGNPLAQPILVLVTDARERPVADVEVAFVF
ncbi:MAG: hypothetical protein H0T44_13880, partial [Gemmatimonadales bacterium]|nr:hypothetical protein [Gemmatimonadales bacterium]